MKRFRYNEVLEELEEVDPPDWVELEKVEAEKKAQEERDRQARQINPRGYL